AALADQKVDIILAPFASPMESAAEKLRRWRRYLPARAYDNSCYLLACNLVWELSSGKTSPGTALIVDPKGRELASRSTKGGSMCRACFDRRLIESIHQKRDAYFVGKKRAGRMPNIFPTLSICHASTAKSCILQ
ncbi:MAG: hypothetical protein JW808_03495, partial [Victivallales bacterium]|nr:hypothetical protein [Victivallales bacterium]